jgi:hypothetical protein
MACKHDEYHAVRSAYDQDEGVLVFFWTCERCGERLNEALREQYRPQFDPHGNDPYLADVQAA